MFWKRAVHKYAHIYAYIYIYIYIPKHNIWILAMALQAHFSFAMPGGYRVLEKSSSYIPFIVRHYFRESLICHQQSLDLNRNLNTLWVIHQERQDTLLSCPLRPGLHLPTHLIGQWAFHIFSIISCNPLIHHHSLARQWHANIPQNPPLLLLQMYIVWAFSGRHYLELVNTDLLPALFRSGHTLAYVLT